MHITHIHEHYFSYRRCFVLTHVNSCDILVSYLWRYKGGRCDLYGRKAIDRKGGSRKNPRNALHRQEVSPRWCDTGDQAPRWNLASESVRCGCISQRAEVPETRGNEITLSAAQHQPSSFQPLSRCFARCYLMPIIQRFATKCDVAQWHGGSVESEDGA